MKYLEEFKKLLSKKIGDVDIDENSNLRSLGVDSLDLVEIVLEIEDMYDVSFENDELNSFKTVKDVIVAIEKRKS
ncbi:TPA: acyl carrier protein [bacterium]|jgi:acyl carrier protein|nr:acyl carrier protein [bacterium]